MRRRQFLMMGGATLVCRVPAFAGQNAPPDCGNCAPADPADFGPSLLLALKNRAFVAAFTERVRKQGKPEAKFLYKPWAADIVIMPVEDGARISRFVAADEGRRFGLSDKDVFERAFANLKRRAAKVELFDHGRVLSLHFDPDYNASLLLLPDVWASVPDLPVKLVAAVPSRDVVAFGDGADPGILAGLRKIARGDDNGYPVTRHLLKRVDGRWGALA